MSSASSPGSSSSAADVWELPALHGVTPLEHTADVGLEIEAGGPKAIFRLAALGMVALLHDALPGESVEVRRLELDAPDLPTLLREWLREILFWHETEGFVPSRAQLGRLEATGLEAIVHGSVPDHEPVREIKGVTLHGLTAEERDRGWYARMIFDV